MKKVYLFIGSISVIASGILAFILWKFPPTNDTGNIIWENVVFFSISLTVSLNGILGFIIYLFRRLIKRVENPRDIFRQSLRQGLFLAFIFDGLLIFQRMEVLTTINILLLTLIFVTIEIYLTNARHRKSHVSGKNTPTTPKK